MMIYEYFGKTNLVPLSEVDESLVNYGIEVDIANSTMDDKSIEWSRWDEDPGKLMLCFANELSEQDKTKLDALVAEY